MSINAVTGMLVSASNMNAINEAATYEWEVPYGKDKIQEFMGNNGCFYTHRMAGLPIFQCKLKNGWFGGGHLYLYKMVGGSEVLVQSDSWGWSTDQTITWNSTGPGWYRLYSDDWAFDAVPCKIWCGDISCVPGGEIKCAADWKVNSGAYISGMALSAELANTRSRICQLGH